MLITGNTFPVKDQLRELGGRWNQEAKGWDVPDDQVEAAKALVANAPRKKFENGDGPRPTKCKVCGVQQEWKRGYPNVRIYRSGECKDCYEERKNGY